MKLEGKGLASIFPMAFTCALLLFLLVAASLFCSGVLGLSGPSRPKRQRSSHIQRPYQKIGSQDRTRRDAEVHSDSENERTVVILFHKPANVLTSHISEDSRSTVYEEVQDMSNFVGASDRSDGNSKYLTFPEATKIQSKLHAIGRLDADTTGLLLLTNDGGLVHHVTNRNAPTHAATDASGITKTYQAVIMGHHDESTLATLWDGVDIGHKYGGMTRPVHDLQVLGHPSCKTTLVSLTISEGRNRQIRRMFHALGSGVMKLKRTKIGRDLSLSGVEEGKWRLLTDDEVRKALHWEPQDLVEARRAATGTKSRGLPRNSTAKGQGRRSNAKFPSVRRRKRL